ncbi:hypothetical protein NXF25_020020 [Crotalus adamanteus]|uniref:Uncharacterized protein n=1 Tax=Crotalus adamanteus TaxID=8729 RepID=A0AAW1B3L3_CROAD
MTSEFTSGTCETSTEASFIKYLLEKLESLIYKLNCEIKQWNTQCHTATDTLKKITHKFTFQFIGKVKTLLTTSLFVCVCVCVCVRAIQYYIIPQI